MFNLHFMLRSIFVALNSDDTHGWRRNDLLALRHLICERVLANLRLENHSQLARSFSRATV